MDQLHSNHHSARLTTSTLTGFTADDTGFAHTTFTPTATGNYTFVLYFGGQNLTGANPPPGGWTGAYASSAQYIGIYYQPSRTSQSKQLQFNPHL